MSFSSITNFTVTAGTLRMLSLLTLYWRDEQLQWNASDFSGITRISLDSNAIWNPVLAQMTDVGYEFPVSPIWVYSNGDILLVSAGEMTGNCKIDMRYFPYDVHECNFDLVSIVHTSGEISLQSSADKVSLELYLKSGQWDLLDTQSYVTIISDNETGNSLDYYINKVRIRRRPQFLILHVAIPMALILILNTFVYIVPLESGERISISVTLLLTMVFFTTDLSDTIPESSDNISIISMLMVAVNSTSALSVAASVVLCRVVTSSKKKIPRLLIWIACTRLPKVKPRIGTNKVKDISIIQDEIECDVALERPGPNVTRKDPEISWADVAKSVDCILFTLTFLFVVVVCAGFTGVMVYVHTKSFEYENDPDGKTG